MEPPMAIAADADPALRIDEGGTVRIGPTRVTLRSVVFAFNEGASAEEIVLRYPSLDLTDTYAAITYYLRHRFEVDRMLAKEDRQIEEVQEEIEREFPTAELPVLDLLRRRRVDGPLGLELGPPTLDAGQDAAVEILVGADDHRRRLRDRMPSPGPKPPDPAARVVRLPL